MTLKCCRTTFPARRYSLQHHLPSDSLPLANMFSHLSLETMKTRLWKHLTGKNRNCSCRLVILKTMPRTYAQIQSDAKKFESCLCAMFEEVIAAVVDGCLPNVFSGPRDEAERIRILDDLVLKKAGHIFRVLDFQFGMEMSIMGRWVTINLFQDADAPPWFRVGGLDIPLGRPLMGHTTASEPGFEKARGWLRQCLESHDCGTKAQGANPNRPPKRLLELRGNRIQLLETDKSESHFDAPYVCLSHRWGDAQHRRLTSTVKTIQQHLQGISWDDLPRTFQDAVAVYRRMCVEYLWIDSLCILQEFDNMTDAEAEQTRADFAQENSLMATIYRNSYFTISADISTNMTSGIFGARSYTGHRIEVIDDGGNASSLFIREPISHSTTTDLETRGWTFQESLLPARVLGFGPFDISWRCQGRHTCECGEIKSMPGWRWILGRSCRPHSDTHTPKWWQGVVSIYSSRILTNELDKLPALSGVAQIYDESTAGDTYLAGLWQSFLHHGLCWYQLKDIDSYCEFVDVPYPVGIGVGRMPRAFRAPSWSWASLDSCGDAFCCQWWPGAGGIRLESQGDGEDFGAAGLREACTIYEALCKPKTKDMFGEIELGAYVNIGTKLISAIIVAAPETDVESGLGRSGQRPVRGILPWTLSLVETDREVIFCIPDCRLEDDGLELGDSVCCAPILEDLTESESQLGCLILKVMRAQQYRRVGFCTLGKRNPYFAQYTRQQLDDLQEKEYRLRGTNLAAAEEALAGKNLCHALHCSQEAESRITIV